MKHGHLKVILWDSGSYLTLLFQLAFSATALAGKRVLLPFYFYCQVEAEVQVSHSASVDISWMRVGVLVPHVVSTAPWVRMASVLQKWVKVFSPGGLLGHHPSRDASRLPVWMKSRLSRSLHGPWVWEASLPAGWGESPLTLLGLLGNHPGRDVGVPRGKPGEGGNLCSSLGLC